MAADVEQERREASVPSTLLYPCDPWRRLIMSNRLKTATLSSLALIICGAAGAEPSADAAKHPIKGEKQLAAAAACPELESLRMYEFYSAAGMAASDGHHHSDSIGSHHHHDTAQAAGTPAEFGHAAKRFDV